jgi:hypothetical protein
MELTHGKLHWLNDVYLIGDKLYSNKINSNCEISVAHQTKIKVHSAFYWDKGLWQERTLAAERKIESAFLHKRHTIAGYSHIVGDECFPIFYMLEKNRIKIDGIINIPNSERVSDLTQTWDKTLEKLTPYSVIENREVSEGVANVYIRNAYCGWQTNTLTFKDKNFDYGSYAEQVRLKLKVKNNFNKDKIIFEIRNGDRRKIVNIDQIKSEMSDLNIEFVSFSNMTNKEQIETVYNAGTLIAQHGAGLTNAIFMKPGSKVIELLPESYKEYGSYELFAKMFGINYIRHIEPEKNCIAKESEEDKQEYKKNKDLIININKLKNVLLK